MKAIALRHCLHRARFVPAAWQTFEYQTSIWSRFNVRHWSGLTSAKSVQSRNLVSATSESVSAIYESQEEIDMEENLSYEAAIQALNSLQSNAATLQKIRKERASHVHLNLPLMRQYLERSGMSLEDLDSLKIIHVSGTKGKGSTCAFTESILRHHGLRTGFYSSPHLVSATERVRIDGQPIDKDKFTEYFWDVYNKVCRGRGSEDRPAYFQFLTLLAFNIFHRENVDVAIIEVGIGGEYDSTNIIRKPVVTGITALGLDHTNILGNTISEIAWHKAGIMKAGVPTYIDPQLHSSAMEVISRRSVDLCALSVAKVPALQEFDWGRYPVVLGLQGKVQQKNASMALALSKHFLSSIGQDITPASHEDPAEANISQMEPFRLSAKDALGLRLADWPGRSQVIDHGRVVYLMDGAHTLESIKECRAWFSAASKLAVQKPADKVFKVMVFNISGDRDAKCLLQQFLNSDLDLVIFCTNISGANGPVDQQNFTTTDKIQLSKCESNLHTWTKLQTSSPPTTTFLNETIKPSVRIPGIIIPTINDTLQWITQGTDPKLKEGAPSITEHPVPQELHDADQVQVLFTGSLHLVGNALASIEPDGLPVKQVDPQLLAMYRRLSETS